MQNVFDAGTVYRNHIILLKMVLDFQAYVIQKHMDTGLVFGFPALEIQPLACYHPCDMVRHTKVCTLAPGDSATEKFNEYLNIFVDHMREQLWYHKGEPEDTNTSLPSWYQHPALTWRLFIDLVFEKSMEYIQE